MDSVASDLRELLIGGGAALVGFADMGRVEAEARHGLPGAVSIAIALTPAIVAGILEAPTEDYAGEYNRRNAMLADLAAAAVAFLEERGYRAAANPPSGSSDPATLRTPLPHKTAATRAGLGWIGKCAVLVTPEYGAAVRLTTVLTDAPLPYGEPIDASRCGRCRVCVDVCPGQAATGRDWEVGRPREWLFDAFACRDAAIRVARAAGISRDICGRCVRACPWTEKYLRRSGAL